MKFSVVMPWGQKVNYNMTEEQLVRAYAETELGYMENEVLDGYRDEVPAKDEIVNDLYLNIVNGARCNIALDGTEIDFIFPDAVRFETAEKIKSIIGAVYSETF